MKFHRIGIKMWETSLYPPGLQLYTVRNELKADFYGTLRKIADMGYQTVEFVRPSLIGTEEIPAEEQRRALDQLGLRAIGVHISLDDLANHLNEQLHFASIIGAKYIVLSYVPEETLQDANEFKSLIILLKKAGAETKRHGLQLLFHNHAPEFRMVNGMYIMDRIIDQVGSDLLKAELDLGWIHKAGADPIKVLKSYKGRVELIHIKDVDKAGNFTEVGKGVIPYEGILHIAREADVEYYFVEQDDSPHPLESAKISLDFLKSSGA